MWTVATQWIPENLMPVPEKDEWRRIAKQALSEIRGGVRITFSRLQEGWRLESLMWRGSDREALGTSTEGQEKELRELVKSALLRAGKPVI